MPIDPKIENDLLAIESALDKVETAVTNVQAMVSDIRILLGSNPPPPPPTDTPISYGANSSLRTSATTVSLTFTLNGTLSRVTRLATIISGQPTSWKEYLPLPTISQTMKLDVAVPSTTGAASVYLHVWDSKKTAANGSVGDWLIAPMPFGAWQGEPPPPPPPPPSGSGVFTFADVGGNLSTLKDGKLFIPRGFNMPGPNGYWGGGFTPMGKASTLKNDWHVNLIRLFEQDPGGGECGACPSAHNPWSIDDVIAEYTAQGIVVMVDYHQFDFGKSYGPNETNKMIQFWTPIATRHKDNPYVWFNLANEPENDGGGQDTPGMANRWYNAFAPVIDAVRATGAKNMIVIDDGNAGQGMSDFFHMGQSSGSAVLLRGSDLVKRDPLGLVMFDMHGYDNIGWLAPGEANNVCNPRYSDAQRDARFTDYVKRVWQATGRPVMIGEGGWRVGDSLTSGSGFHYPYTTCGSRTMAGQMATTRNAVGLNTGFIQWTGFQVTYSGTNAYDSQNRTECGEDFWRFCQAGNAKELGGVSVATTGFPHAATMQGLMRKPAAIAYNEQGEAVEASPSGSTDQGVAQSLDLLRMCRPQRNTLGVHRETPTGDTEARRFA